jgi:hydrogenase maturation protease
MERGNMQPQSIVIIGIGNLLKQDDGIGLHAVRYLQGKVPEGVELVEGSTYAADLLPALESRSTAIFIDGLEAGEEPGAVFRFTPQELLRPRSKRSISVHDFGVLELLDAALLLDQSPDEIVIIGVQVKELGTGIELSEELERALPQIHRLVLEEIAKAQKR